jgi:hypothetical protein
MEHPDKMEQQLEIQKLICGMWRMRIELLNVGGRSSALLWPHMTADSIYFAPSPLQIDVIHLDV